MVIHYYKTVKSKRILEGIMELLTMCGDEFVPPLSSRSSTTQSALSGGGGSGGAPYEYFEGIRAQSAFAAVQNGKVVGFMSFKKNYISARIPPAFQPNVYITTVIVHPQFRNRGITGKLYGALFSKFEGYHIFTRTWSANVSHIRILRSRKFYEFCRLENDRGAGIDTIYYHRKPATRGRLQSIRQYHLTGSLVFLALLVLLITAFLVTWLMTSSGVAHDLSIAVFTSLIASALCLFSDTILKIRESKNDEYINTLKSYGIENLQFHKDELLESILPKCSEEIWISGYRLIMTSKKSFLEALEKACKNSPGIRVRVLTVAPWSETFRLVYGDEDVTDNYIKVFGTLGKCMAEYSTALEIRMTETPIFNDTYKVDDRFVTGPYLHCADKNNMKITAKDFFSLDIDNPHKELFDIIYKDYTAVWNSSDCALSCFGFYRCLEEEREAVEGYTKEQKLDFIKRWCYPLTAHAEDPRAD